MTAFRLFAAVLVIGTGFASAQTTAAAPPRDKRVFGVIPNYRTAEASAPFHPISRREKMKIAKQDSFDWPVFLTAGAFAGLYHLQDQNPSFGQGMSGYGKRYGGAYGDQLTGNLFTEGIMPSLLHQDPRYFRLGKGSFGRRMCYALSRVVITKNDSGRRAFNFSEWSGNSISVALSNSYYPDTRTASDNAERLAVAVGTDAVGNVLKEFWPDVKGRFHRKPDPATAPPVPGRTSPSK
jgi:hypothetical protein